MQEYWNQRYKDNEIVYGYEPNEFLKEFIDKNKPGTILFPAEGEGRNSIYAAQKGWTATAFDFSEVAKEKALQMAAQKNLTINYTIDGLDTYQAPEQFNAIALIYVHMPPALRTAVHNKMIQALKPGGYLVLEAFSKSQLGKQSGGPTDINLLFDTDTLSSDFATLDIIQLESIETTLKEGPYHEGPASIVRLLAMKKPTN